MTVFFFLQKANAGKFRLVLSNVKLSFKLVSTAPSVLSSIVSRLDAGAMALYPYTRTGVVTRTVGIGEASKEFSYLYTGSLPTQILAGDDNCK